MRRNKSNFCVVIGMLAAVIPVAGQSLVLSIPRDSQRAVISQRVGLTDVTITYHRPLVNSRKIWDGVVPYGKVWRAGANENTTVEFTDAVMIEDHPLGKGIYGLHMIPGADSWSIIFSKNYTSWGSFSYQEEEDALRVNVKPQTAEFHEALQYDFDEVKPDSTVVTMKWEKVAVPMRISVNVTETALQKIRNQLRDLPQYTWMSWDDAATYCVDHKVNLDEALRWSDKSIASEERFDNYLTKSKVLKALNRPEEATAAFNHATELAHPIQLYFYGRQLQFEKQKDQAMDMFRLTAKRFPDHWVAHLALARVSSAAGDFPSAIKELKTAQTIGVASDQQKNVERLLQRLEKSEDINN